MRIKSDVEFVKRECASDKSVGWQDVMECRCGETVTDVHKLSGNKVKCTFPDGGWYYYTPDCLKEYIILEKGKKYTVSGLEILFEFIEESENYAIFKTPSGYFRTFEKEHNNFVEHTNNVPNFMKVEWEIEKNSIENKVHIICGGIPVAVFSKEGFTLNKFHSPNSI